MFRAGSAGCTAGAGGAGRWWPVLPPTDTTTHSDQTGQGGVTEETHESGARVHWLYLLDYWRWEGGLPGEYVDSYFVSLCIKVTTSAAYRPNVNFSIV